MYLFEHEARCLEFFGSPFTEVHEFLDQFAKKVGLHKHRQFLHNPEGIIKIVNLFGESARCPALLHLYDDYEYFQYWDNTGHLRKNIKDYIYG